MEEINKYPSLLNQSKNLAKFSWRLIQYLQQQDDGENKNLMVSEKVYNDRLEVCKVCPKFDKDQTRCFECGCYLPVKAKFVLDDCPLNKWTMSEEEWESTFNNIIKDMEVDE